MKPIIQIFQIDTTKTDTHAVLKNLLKKNSGQSKLTFKKNPNGKPRLVDSDIEFNLSHSGDMALIAISKNIPVGIDVQKIEDKTNVLKIAGRFFSKRESDTLLKLAPTKQRRAFFKLWVKKEAIIKARGGKLTDMKNDLKNEKEYSVRLFEVNEGYVAAVAATGKSWETTLSRKLSPLVLEISGVLPKATKAAKLAKDYKKYLRKKYQ